MEEDIEICFDEQKLKGIFILKNNIGEELILDFLLVDDESVDKSVIFKELNIKLDENTVHNFLKKKEKWTHFKKYIIVIKIEKYGKIDNKDQIIKVIDSFNLPENIHFILYEKIISNEFLISSLF